MTFRIKLKDQNLEGSDLVVVVSGKLSVYYTLWNDSMTDAEGNPRSGYICNLSTDHAEAMQKAEAIKAKSGASSLIECDRQELNGSSTVIPFGKHKGVAFWDAPESYVAWMFRSTDLQSKHPRLASNIESRLTQAIEIYDEKVEATKSARTHIGTEGEVVSMTLIKTKFEITTVKENYHAFSTKNWEIKANTSTGSSVKFNFKNVSEYATASDKMMEFQIAKAVEAGEEVEITATVKSNEEFKGWKWSMLKDVKLTNVPSVIAEKIEKEDEEEAIYKEEQTQAKKVLAKARRTWKLPMTLTPAVEGDTYIVAPNNPHMRKEVSVITRDVVKNVTIITYTDMGSVSIDVSFDGEMIPRCFGNDWKKIKKVVIAFLATKV
jgi:uncharacterized protein (DUF3820 family)